MAINFKIDFTNKYQIENISEDMRESTFTTILQGGQQVPLYVKIDNKSHALLPDVYNLSFGPLRNGRIDDKAELSHADYSKVFSTILVSALIYLTNNPEHSLGIDGSDNRRAYLYYWALLRNFDYLDQYFHMSGLKYYVRITRFGKEQYDNPFDFVDIIPDTVPIKKDIKISPYLMYNYFTFKLKNY